MDCRSISTKLIIIVVLFAFTACSNEKTTNTSQTTPTEAEPTSYQPAHGGRLIDASIGDATNLIPMIASDASSHDIAGQLYLPLLKYDKNLNLVGQLAESWEISEDKLSIIFKLKPNLKWSDGEPLTSDDLVFTLQLIQDDKTQSPYKSDYMKVISAKAIDQRTFEVRYKEIFSPALATWASLAILPKHVFKDVNIMDTDLSRHPKASIGPYFLKDWQTQQSITMTANPNYFAGDVWIDERITRIIPDPATQFLELSAGKIDMANLTPTQYTRLFDNNQRLKHEYNRYKYLGFSYTYLGFNLTRKPFDDVRVRQALAYAIDRQELVDGVLLGLGEVLATPYKPGTRWVNQSIKPRPFSLQHAQTLLTEAGWTKKEGQDYVSKNGKPLSFTILTNNGNKKRADTATIIQQRLKSIGIQVNIRLVEWSAFIENFINKRDFDAVILGWSLSPDPDQFNIWHSSQTGERQFNFLSYSNPKVDEALEQARLTFDLDQQKQWYDIMQQEIHNDVPVVFLYAGYSLPAIHKRIQGIEVAPAGIGHNSEFWYIPKLLQKTSITAE
ncbi:peptide-binding protein [Ghiorsea bivora]|uniref:peptide-binding protein n=1 Tax=Ghiorsea bivora TaxID=1485545 RepID=UPI00056F0558|nr:peptide-binding protein [Ghiorsea bivora]